MATPLLDVFIDPWFDVAERLKVRISATGIGGVTGLMPEISFSRSNKFVQIFGQFLSSFNTGFVAGQDFVSKKGASPDLAFMLQEMTNSTWQGSEALSFQLPLLYISRRGATLDVVNPIRKITQLSSPAVWGQASVTFLERTWTGTALRPPPYVHVEVGNVLSIQRAIITNVEMKLSDVRDFAGQPTEALVTLTINTDRMFVDGDPNVNFIGNMSGSVPVSPKDLTEVKP